MSAVYPLLFSCHLNLNEEPILFDTSYVHKKNPNKLSTRNVYRLFLEAKLWTKNSQALTNNTDYQIKL